MYVIHQSLNHSMHLLMLKSCQLCSIPLLSSPLSTGQSPVQNAFLPGCWGLSLKDKHPDLWSQRKVHRLWDKFYKFLFWFCLVVFFFCFVFLNKEVFGSVLKVMLKYVILSKTKDFFLILLSYISLSLLFEKL